MTPPSQVLIDTCSLINLAIDADMWSRTKDHFAGRAGTAQIVVEELKLLQTDPKVSAHVHRVLADLDWLGVPIAVDDDDDLAEATRIQGDIAAGRTLHHPGEHLGESILIVLARPDASRILMDDYNARFKAKSEGVTSISIHRLFHQWIRSGVIDAAKAKAFADAIRTAGRGSDYTEEELKRGGRRAMGRVWEP